MTDQKMSIVPNPELVETWYEEAPVYAREDADYEEFIARRAAEWGANQELEACCALLEQISFSEIDDIVNYLRENRRPKASSLKQQAIKLLDRIQSNKEWWQLEELSIIRRALDEVPDND